MRHCAIWFSENDFGNKICKGIESSSRHSLNKIAGKPSGPDAELEDISLIASQITDWFIMISDNMRPGATKGTLRRKNENSFFDVLCLIKVHWSF